MKTLEDGFWIAVAIAFIVMAIGGCASKQANYWGSLSQQVGQRIN